MRSISIALALMLLASPALAQQKPDPVAQAAASSVQATIASLQLLMNAYEAQASRLAWYDSYFKGLENPQPPQVKEESTK